MSVQTGIDVVLADDDAFARLDGRTLGLVTNQTGVTADLDYTREAMVDAGLDLARLFSPEHGIWGVHGGEVTDATDELTGLPCHSLFGDRRTPTADHLADLDALVFDIQDAGARCWTYLSTLRNCMGAAADADVPFVVLDRPNPLTGTLVEGPVMDAAFESFVGHRDLPMVHGLTVGEFARFANAEYGVGADLDVVAARGWDRGTWFDGTGLLWGPSSPALFFVERALVYPGTVLAEGTNLSYAGEGHRPTLLTAPYVDATEFLPVARDRLAEFDLDGAALRALKTGSGDDTEWGVQIHVADREAFRPVATALVLLATVAELYPDEFAWREDDGDYGVDRLVGTDAVREAIDGGAPIEDLVALTEAGVEDYLETRERYLLY